MQKLRKQDLVIKTPGLQIRERIQRDYGDLRTFAEMIDMSESSVDQYLTQKTLGSSTFKIRLIRELGQDFRDLYQSDEAQLEKLIERFILELPYYEQLSELQMAQALYALAKSSEASGPQMAWVYYGLAIYKEACGETQQALAYLSRGLATVRRLKASEADGLLQAALLTQMICLESPTASLEKLHQDLASWTSCIKQVENRDQRAKWIRWVGQAFADRGELAVAQYHFTMAADTADSELEKGLSLLAGGSICEEAPACQVAIEMAEQRLRGERSAVLDLLLARAKCAMLNGEDREALNYLHMAIERCGRKLTAHSSQLSLLLYQQWLRVFPETTEIEAAFRRHFLPMVSELGKGYCHARGHLKVTLDFLATHPFSGLEAFELLKALGKVHDPDRYHPGIAEIYLKVLGRLTVMAFGSGLSDEVLTEAYDSNVFSEPKEHEEPVS